MKYKMVFLKVGNPNMKQIIKPNSIQTNWGEIEIWDKLVYSEIVINWCTTEDTQRLDGSHSQWRWRRYVKLRKPNKGIKVQVTKFY